MDEQTLTHRAFASFYILGLVHTEQKRRRKWKQIKVKTTNIKGNFRFRSVWMGLKHLAELFKTDSSHELLW